MKKILNDPKLVGKTAKELVNSEYPPRVQILGPWLTKPSLVMAHAWRGVGKTFFALSCAQSIASGSPFLKWKPQIERKVLYIDGEMGEASLKERLLKVDSGALISAGAELIKFITFENTGGVIWNLASTAYQEFYTKAAEDFDLIIIDNISSCVKTIGKETDRDAWLRVQEWAQNMRVAGKSILFIHHSGKAGTQRGISDREDALDTVICLKRLEGYKPDEGCVFGLEFEKCRHFYGQDAENLYVKLETSEHGLKWYFENLEDFLTSKEKQKETTIKTGYDDDNNTF